MTQTEIVDIVWEWMSVTDQTTKKEQTSVPNPENYTIIFNADGTLTGTADCNTFAGVYSQESGFTIKLGTLHDGVLRRGVARCDLPPVVEQRGR